jgi:hypothetical protein
MDLVMVLNAERSTVLILGLPPPLVNKVGVFSAISEDCWLGSAVFECISIDHNQDGSLRSRLC